MALPVKAPMGSGSADVNDYFNPEIGIIIIIIMFERKY